MREQTTINTFTGNPLITPPLGPAVVGYRRWPNGFPRGGGSGGFSESSGLDESSEIDDELDWEAEAASGGGAGYYWGWYKGVNVRHDGPTPAGFASEAQARLDDPGATKVLDTAGVTKAAPTTPAQIGPSMRADDRSWASKFFHETYAKATGFFTTPTATPASRVYHLAAKPAVVGFVDGVQNLYGMVRHPITTAKNAVRGVYVVVTNPGTVGEAAYHQYVEFQTLPSDQKAAAVSRFAGEAVFDAAAGKLLLKAKDAANLKSFVGIRSSNDQLPTGAGWAGDPGAAARYSEILATDDVAVLAKHSGLPENVIRSVKTHVFDTIHQIPVGPDEWYIGRFHPSTVNADLWQAASRGERINEFKLLIGHEYLEHTLMKHHGLPYRSPHPSAWDNGSSFATPTHFGAHDLAPHAWEPRPLSEQQLMMWENFFNRP